jgi:UDP-glucuronate 4-epimerase
MKILVTGAAGFIGYHTCLHLVSLGHEVYGVDNINDYYDPKLKFNRLSELGLGESETKIFNNEVQSTKFRNIRFTRLDLVDNDSVDELFGREQFEVVCNLAAQAGVRYSLENPRAYIDSNVLGFLNVLEGCRNHMVNHLIYASSSSVYGENKKVPFETTDNVDSPISLYAATKRSNELMAHTYSHLYGFKTTGLRFFTVYGPWGRPDMAYFLFTDAILKNDPISVFNMGEMERDFTYIDDIVNGITRIIEKRLNRQEISRIYNIGNNKTETIADFILAIERAIDKKAIRKMLPMQPGDVKRTWANIDSLIKDYGYKPDTPIEVGIKKFVDWYLLYYENAKKI